MASRDPLVEPTRGSWSSPVMKVPKPDGSIRFRCLPSKYHKIQTNKQSIVEGVRVMCVRCKDWYKDWSSNGFERAFPLRCFSLSSPLSLASVDRCGLEQPLSRYGRVP